MMDLGTAVLNDFYRGIAELQSLLQRVHFGGFLSIRIMKRNFKACVEMIT